MFSWIGFNKAGVLYDRDERYAGETKYPLRRMLQFAVDGIVSFSNAPLRPALALGFIVSLTSFVYGFVAITLKLVGAFTVPGWTSVIFVTSILGGVQLMVLGVIGSTWARRTSKQRNAPCTSSAARSVSSASPPPSEPFVWLPTAEARPQQRVSVQTETMDGNDGG
jgi:polyisoprenyl-phosphate glycosyltransferase